MCCLVLLLAFFGPRTALVYLWLVGYLDGVFATVLWPLIGFLFLPFTTLVYAFAMHNGGLTNFAVVMLIVAALLDFGVLGGAERHRRRRVIVDDDD
ncbi:MAG TPA: hypothetical protein VKX17_19345 [Planctomycetota bacterium]|nr:hypothetical protein [Planctomycetota bacterium]